MSTTTEDAMPRRISLDAQTTPTNALNRLRKAFDTLHTQTFTGKPGDLLPYLAQLTTIDGALLRLEELNDTTNIKITS